MSLSKKAFGSWPYLKPNRGGVAQCLPCIVVGTFCPEQVGLCALAMMLGEVFQMALQDLNDAVCLQTALGEKRQ